MQSVNALGRASAFSTYTELEKIELGPNGVNALDRASAFSTSRRMTVVSAGVCEC